MEKLLLQTITSAAKSDKYLMGQRTKNICYSCRATTNIFCNRTAKGFFESTYIRMNYLSKPITGLSKKLETYFRTRHMAVASGQDPGRAE